MSSVLLLLITSVLVHADAVQTDQDNSHVDSADEYSVGNLWLCLERARARGHDVEVMEVMPGYGWDNLRNVDEGQVVYFNYSQCRTTDDGRFLLPDSVSAVPVKSSRVQYFAELINHWKSWTSTSAYSINAEAGFSSMFTTISGKFSSEFSAIKSKQIAEKSATTRTQLRYIRYAVQLQPDTPLHPVFKKRVLGIATARQLGEDSKADYLSELLVRDFGTHIVTKADAGAALLLVDQIRDEWVQRQSQSDKKGEILASATRNFLEFFSISASISLGAQTSDQVVADYNSQRTSSTVFSAGGPTFLPSNFTPTSWANLVDRNLVAQDRSGSPLYYVITEEVLPEVPPLVVRKVYDGIKAAVTSYYSYNRIPGCLDPSSPNFSPAANVDDNSCIPPSYNITFGGVFQTCVPYDDPQNDFDLCKEVSQVNPLTGGYNCPEHYLAVMLQYANSSINRIEHFCDKVRGNLKRCYYNFFPGKVFYETFWCVALRPAKAQSGYFFGGLFTSKVGNPVTGAFSCPPSFFPLRIGHLGDLRVCVSDDRRLPNNQAVRFGGFYSCDVGNPIALDIAPGSDFPSNRSAWFKQCPKGYSVHLATVNQGCHIYYCVTTGSLSQEILPPVKRPPFSPDPPLSPPEGEHPVYFDTLADIWYRNGEPTTTTEAPTFSLAARGTFSSFPVIVMMMAASLSLMV